MDFLFEIEVEAIYRFGKSLLLQIDSLRNILDLLYLFFTTCFIYLTIYEKLLRRLLNVRGPHSVIDNNDVFVYFTSYLVMIS